MKKIAIITSAIVFYTILQICGCSCINANATASANEENISFYEVPLVCPAAPAIGCGSKAKPVLYGLEKKNNVVSQAWLNRTGTVIAVVWNENVTSEMKTVTANEIFNENKLDAVLLLGKKHKKILKEFQDKKNWYRTEEVNKLSMEEADIIAVRLVKRINEKTSIDISKSESLKKEFTDVFKNSFTQSFTSEINSNPEKDIQNWKEEIEKKLIEAGNKYLNEAELTVLKEAIALGLRPTEKECKNDKSCCSSHDVKKQCCSKK